MAEIDRRRLALVRCTLSGGAGAKVGTGYFISADLLLTASHVVPIDGLERIDLRTEADGVWHAAQALAVWRDELADAVLLRVDQALDQVDDIAWADEGFGANVPWHSAGYPVAALSEQAGHTEWHTVGLAGTLYGVGGGGQGRKALDLGVDHPPLASRWAGASGAPVFVGERLAGIIKEVPPDFQGDRLLGVPATALLQSHSFRLALSKPWRVPDAQAQAPWVLVVLSEASDTELGDWVDGTLQNDGADIALAMGRAPQPAGVRISINDALQSPGHWLQLVKLLCAAPLAVFDATDFEPAVMLALGVRAVVRRGVTITSTARVLTPEQLAALPFNIKETKLVYHGYAYKPGDEKHPYRTLAGAIKSGWRELHNQPRYLDLPAYDGVRCPYPSAYTGDIGAVERVLVLCSFDPQFDPNWLTLANALALRYARREPSRMLDAPSPRLVGQALYEGIRWAKSCVVDWTGWRPNVFFELGVRLACADLGPICLIDAADPGIAGAAALPQMRRLLELLRPTAYLPTPSDERQLAAQRRKPLLDAFNLHDAIAAGTPPALPATALPHDATYRTCIDNFEWSQEGITTLPHEALRRSVQDPFGPDPHAEGRQPILFSVNPGYSAELGRSVRERWIAAWYYLVNRHPEDHPDEKQRWANNPALREALRTLANQVLQFGPAKDDPDPHLQELRKQLTRVLIRLRKLDSGSDSQPGARP